MNDINSHTISRGGFRTSARVIALALALFASFDRVAFGQQRADPVAIGVGKATVATGRGLSALYGNIGALALDPLGPRRGDVPRVEIDATVLPVGIAAGSTYLNADELAFVFGDKDQSVFSDDDRIRLSQLLAGEKLSADAAIDGMAIRLSYPGVGALGVRFGNHVRARMRFPENFRTTVLGTGDVFASDQTFSAADVGGQWIRRLEVDAATAFRRVIRDTTKSSWFPTVGVGVGLSKIDGVADFEVDPHSAVQTTVIPSPPGSGYRSLDVNGSFSFRSSVPRRFDATSAILKPGFSEADSISGHGWGGSIGVSAVIYRSVRRLHEVRSGDPLNPQKVMRDETITRDAVMAGIAIDEIGSIDWDGFNLARSRIIDTVVTDRDGGLTYALLNGYRGDLDTIGAFTTELPTVLRMGVGVDVTAFVPSISGDLFASIEGAIDLKENAIGGERTPRLSLGASWAPMPWLTLRSGLQLGGRVGSAWSLGAGVRPFSWLSIDAATSELTSLVAADPDRYDVAFRIATHFQF